MKKNLTREQMIALIASDYGYGPETTNKLTTKVLRDTCKSSQSHIYLKSLLENPNPDIFLVNEI